MKIVIQRVKEAAVTVDGKTVGSIGQGLLLLVGVELGDTKEIAEKMIEKTFIRDYYREVAQKYDVSIHKQENVKVYLNEFVIVISLR